LTIAIERDTTLNALAVEAFNDLLRKYGKRTAVNTGKRLSVETDGVSICRH